VGYTRRNLFRVRQFFEAYRSHKKVSPLVTQLPWTQHLIILSEAKPVETREVYVLAAIKERSAGRSESSSDKSERARCYELRPSRRKCHQR